jgi:hypothetical protein
MRCPFCVRFFFLGKGFFSGNYRVDQNLLNPVEELAIISYLNVYENIYCFFKRGRECHFSIGTRNDPDSVVGATKDTFKIFH